MKRNPIAPLKRAALCAVTAGLLFAAPAAALASDQSAIDGWSTALTSTLNNSFYSAYNSEGTTAAATKTFPSKLDLRDRGVVTPVKNQGDANTCWAHAAIAASETSILSELGTTYTKTGLDLSERHLAYFAYIGAPEACVGAGQAGEGFASNEVAEGTPSPSSVLMIGGFQTSASTLFSAGVGPVLESTAPYKSDKGLITCRVYDESSTEPIPGYKIPSTYYLTYEEAQAKKAEWDAKGFEYTISDGYAVSGFGLDDPGWGLEYTLYGKSAYTLEQSYLLPDVRIMDANGHYAGTNDEAIAAIKEQLNAGRAVAIAVGISATDFYNEDTGAFYNDSDNAKGSAHAMTVVGYDDNYAVSNFKEGQQPQKPGAFLVKNSYGASTNNFPNRGEYGEKDADGNYTGYIWVSYYDHTLADVAAYDYDVNSATSSETFEADQYNYMANQTTLVRASDEKVSSANVFENDSDSGRVLRALSCETAKLNTQATYEVYLLADDAESPTDGTLALAKTVDYEYGGYHRLMLGDDEQLAMRAGQRYSVVVTLKAQIDGAEKYYQTAGKSSKCAYSERPVLKSGDFVAKVNEGESYSLEADGQWSDWTVVTSALAQEQTNCCVDNPPIKAFYQERELASNEELVALRQVIAGAQAKLEGARVSADGSDVDPADEWVTQEDYDALAAAIAQAQATLDLAGNFEVRLAGTTPDSNTVNAAAKAVSGAAAAFSPKPGTKTADGSDDRRDDEADADKTNGDNADASAQTTRPAAQEAESALPSTGDATTAAPVAFLAAFGAALLAAVHRHQN